MDVLELIDETFDKDRTEVYELSIQVYLNGFSFAIKDTIRNTYIVLVSKPFNNQFYNYDNCGDLVDEIVSSYTFISQKYKKVTFAYTKSSFTIIPKEFFEPEKLKDTFELAQRLPDHFELHYNSKTNGTNYTIIFSMPYTLSSAWLKIQPKTKFITPITSLLHNMAISKVNKLLQVCFDEQKLYLVYHEGDKLITANSFEFKNSNDVVYFILSFCKSIGVDTTHITLHFVGQSVNNEEITKLLSSYFSNVSTEAHYNSIHFSYQLLRHRIKYFTLFNSTAVCE